MQPLLIRVAFVSWCNRKVPPWGLQLGLKLCASLGVYAEPIPKTEPWMRERETATQQSVWKKKAWNFFNCVSRLIFSPTLHSSRFLGTAQTGNAGLAVSLTGLLCLSQLGLSLLWPRRVFWESADTSFVFRIEPKPLFCLCVSVSRNTDLLLLLISGLGKAALGLQLIPSNQLQCIRQIWSITALSLCTWANKLTLLQNMNMSGEGAGMLAWIWIYALIPSICGNRAAID